LKKKFFEILTGRGFSISRCVDLSRVRSLMALMHPVKTSEGLIRMGGEQDGGYLVPNDLEKIVACFSPGVDTVASFESALVARGIPCYLADASVDGPPVDSPLIHFDKKFLGVVDDASTVTMDTWVNANAPASGDLILQMDIEGSEWPVILNCSDALLKRFRIVILELHFLERLLDEVGFEFMYAGLDRLLRQYIVVHLHPNNLAKPVQVADLIIPRLLEVTLLRRDRLHPIGYADQFPHPLDRQNMSDRPDLPLPSGWYRSVSES
jgi:Methyltransferase FkbM domain